MTIKFLST